MMNPERPWVVLKFGGTSVSSPARWQTILELARSRRNEGLSPLLVCSAVSGVSDLLEKLLTAAPVGDHEPVLAQLRAKHDTFADEMGLSLVEHAKEELEILKRSALGMALVGEASPGLRAKVMSLGELILTKLGAVWLSAQGCSAAWVDARDCLRSIDPPNLPEARRYLAATCGQKRDEELRQRLKALNAEVVITQGFIARNNAGHTVVLGRGGSDTSAAYFAAAVAAQRCEIWTDVPGMYSADPRWIPEARLLRTLDYDEAQEIASTGAKVLHPRCIAPLRENHIPLSTHCTSQPDLPGTQITGNAPDEGAQVKAISTRRNIILVAMETVGMWQQVGFLADVFAIFKKHGLSVDFVSTSETNVTASLDAAAIALEPSVLESLRADLATICRVRIIQHCAAVSLVGNRIRAILHRLGRALQVFEEQKIHLVSQAASDLNLTFVVDEDQAQRLVRELHGQLFHNLPSGQTFGPSWEELFGSGDTQETMTDLPWWRTRRDELLALAEKSGTPRFVYDPNTIVAACDELKGLAAVDRVLYAVKANANPRLLAIIYEQGLGFECVSPGELTHLKELFGPLPPERLLFTPNFAPRAEYEQGFLAGARVTVDSLYPLKHWPELFRDRELFVRLDPGRGHGHHPHVHTAGAQSKFGVAPEDLDQLAELVKACGARIVGLHAHIGSGVRVPGTWVAVATLMAEMADRFAETTVLDLGGGLAVPEKPSQAGFDLAALDSGLQKVRAANPRFSLWIEPGRYLVARAGVLLARVTQTKHKGQVLYVGVDAGMNSLIRPALYGAHHHIANLSRIDEPRTEVANVVGPICETGDTLGYARRLPPSAEGDLLLIATAGAYGRVMSSHYNQRPPAEELVLEPA